MNLLLKAAHPSWCCSWILGCLLWIGSKVSDVELHFQVIGNHVTMENCNTVMIWEHCCLFDQQLLTQPIMRVWDGTICLIDQWDDTFFDLMQLINEHTFLYIIIDFFTLTFLYLFEVIIIITIYLMPTLFFTLYIFNNNKVKTWTL